MDTPDHQPPLSPRGRRPRWRLALAAAAAVTTLAIVALVAPAGSTTHRSGSSQARSAATAAPAAAIGCPPGATCGTVTVPLDRNNPEVGTTKVAYALVRHADHDRPAAGTIAVNPGGPGSAAIPLAEQFAGWLGDLTRDHDLLLMDPRGTGASGWLDCEVRPDVLTLPRPARVQEMGRCGASLGDHTRHYTSAAAADDLDTIRAHLDIPRLKLYGLSYGTRLMTTYAQRHPERVEAIVLSGAAPLDKDPFKRNNAQTVRDALRLVCERSQGACDSDQTLKDFAGLAKRLRKRPIHFPVTVNGQRRTAVVNEAALVATVYGAAGDLPRWGQLPAVVRAALGGEHDALVELVRGDLLALADLRDAGTLYSVGMALSVMCNDQPTAFDKTAPIDERVRQYDAAIAALPAKDYRPFSPRGFIDGMDESDWCLYWPDRTDRTQTDTRVEADAPVLVLSGDLDINTTPESGRRTAAQFPNATHLVVPNAGHVPTFEPTGCTTQLTEQFFRTGQAGQTDCLDRIPAVPVTPPATRSQP
jgi:pimeloyl-ACP methyl ester carboxylesterase